MNIKRKNSGEFHKKIKEFEEKIKEFEESKNKKTLNILNQKL